MGLGVFGRATRKDASSDLAIVLKSGSEFAEAHGLRNFFVPRTGKNWIEFDFHPAAEFVEIIADNATLTFSAKTSGAGPGYHKLIVDFMDWLAERLDLQWTSDDEHGVDDTSYYERRDFPRLQREMQDFLHALLHSVTEQQPSGGWALNIPSNLQPRFVGVATPMGDWPAESLRRAAMDEAFLSQFIPDFFPWWDKGLTPRALKNCALAALWLNVKWHPPQDEPETQQIQAALEALQAAQALDPSLVIPSDTCRELESLLRGDEIDLKKPGIGYRRRVCRQNMTGRWSLELEGYFYDRDDNGDLNFWYSDRVIWFTSFSAKPPEEPLSAKSGTRTAEILIDHHGISGAANTKRSEDGSFCMSCSFEARASASISTAILTIIYPAEHDRAWAESVLRSVRHADDKN